MCFGACLARGLDRGHSEMDSTVWLEAGERAHNRIDLSVNEKTGGPGLSNGLMKADVTHSHGNAPEESILVFIFILLVLTEDRKAAGSQTSNVAFGARSPSLGGPARLDRGAAWRISTQQEEGTGLPKPIHLRGRNDDNIPFRLSVSRNP